MLAQICQRALLPHSDPFRIVVDAISRVNRFCAEAVDSTCLGITLDGRNPASPKKSWNDDPPAIPNGFRWFQIGAGFRPATVFLGVASVRLRSLGPQGCLVGRFALGGSGDVAAGPEAAYDEVTSAFGGRRLAFLLVFW